MITEMTATFPCGSTIVRDADWEVRYCRWLKVDGQRPIRIEFEGELFTANELRQIHVESRQALHPIKNELWVNNEKIVP